MGRPANFKEVCGAMLHARLYDGGHNDDLIDSYSLILLDGREQYDRLAAAALAEKQRQAEIKREQEARPAPKF